MKKKTYIQPTMEVETFQGEIIMQIGSRAFLLFHFTPPPF